MLEKAWAKVKGNYLMADGGFMENGIRSLIGSPVFHYRTENEDVDATFELMKTANTLNYVMGAGTDGTADSNNNICGIAMSHAYSVIAAFELKTGATVDHKMYMIRNPWGTANFNRTWN